MSDGIRYSHNFPVDEIQELLEAKLKEGRDGAKQAAGLMLTRAAVAIVHIDTTKIRDAYAPGDLRKFYERGTTVGFNDHFGGSESSFKLLLNGSPSGDQSSYVLYSPPDKSGRPTNTTFRNCDFTWLNRASKGQYMYTAPGHVPNPLKTADVASYRGRGPNYEYYLFGGPDAEQQVYDQFAVAGFDFTETPYSSEFGEMGFDNTWVLSRHEDAARQNLGPRGGRFWPGDQFSEQLARLGLDTPKLSAKEYPLVRSENKLS